MKTSDSTTNIFPALAKAQGEMTDPPKNADNDFFHSSYLTLTAMHKMSRPVLSENGLAVVQSYTEHGLETLLAHSSGEWILLDPLPIKAEKQTAQGIGSAVTYSMRYALGGLCQVAGDDDDDGNAASVPREKPVGNTPTPSDGPAPEKKERTPGGASAESLGLARVLFFRLRDSDGNTIAIEPENGETHDVTEVRREQNCFSIAEWLKKNGFDESTGYDDELLHMDQSTLSKVIDKVKAEIAEMDVG